MFFLRGECKKNVVKGMDKKKMKRKGIVGTFLDTVRGRSKRSPNFENNHFAGFAANLPQSATFLRTQTSR